MEKLYNTEDIRKLYKAFIALCDFTEEKVYCGNCPMWDSVCGNKDKKKAREFADALLRIRETTGIKNP